LGVDSAWDTVPKAFKQQRSVILENGDRPFITFKAL